MEMVKRTDILVNFKVVIVCFVPKGVLCVQIVKSVVSLHLFIKFK